MVLCLLVLPSSAAAQGATGPYVTFGAGLNMAGREKADVTVGSMSVPQETGSVGLAAGVVVSGALGLHVRRHVRVDVEAACDPTGSPASDVTRNVTRRSYRGSARGRPPLRPFARAAAAFFALR